MAWNNDVDLVLDTDKINMEKLRLPNAKQKISLIGCAICTLKEKATVRHFVTINTEVVELRQMYLMISELSRQ